MPINCNPACDTYLLSAAFKNQIYLTQCLSHNMGTLQYYLLWIITVWCLVRHMSVCVHVDPHMTQHASPKVKAAWYLLPLGMRLVNGSQGTQQQAQDSTLLQNLQSFPKLMLQLTCVDLFLPKFGNQMSTSNFDVWMQQPTSTGIEWHCQSFSKAEGDHSLCCPTLTTIIELIALLTIVSSSKAIYFTKKALSSLLMCHSNSTSA